MKSPINTTVSNLTAGLTGSWLKSEIKKSGMKDTYRNSEIVLKKFLLNRLSSVTNQTLRKKTNICC